MQVVKDIFFALPLVIAGLVVIGALVMAFIEEPMAIVGVLACIGLVFWIAAAHDYFTWGRYIATDKSPAPIKLDSEKQTVWTLPNVTGTCNCNKKEIEK